MNSFTGAPVTVAVFAGLTVLLTGCIAYDAASTVADVGTTVVSTAGHVAAAPFGGGDDDSDKAKSN